MAGGSGSLNPQDGATGTRQSIKSDGAAISLAPDDGGLLIAGREGATQRHIRVNAAGELVVSSTEPTPGTVVTTGANTAVGVGATVALPVPPANTLSQLVQNVSAGAVEFLFREAGGAAGTGLRFPRLGTLVHNEAVAALEAQHVAGPAGTVAIQWERR
jgi:hypothetical protein